MTIPTVMKNQDTRLMFVQHIPLGEYVRKVTFCYACEGDGGSGVVGDSDKCTVCDGAGFKPGNKVYIRGKYDRGSKRYSLEDTDDTSREVWVKAGTELLVGFDY